MDTQLLPSQHPFAMPPYYKPSPSLSGCAIQCPSIPPSICSSLQCAATRRSEWLPMCHVRSCGSLELMRADRSQCRGIVSGSGDDGGASQCGSPMQQRYLPTMGGRSYPLPPHQQEQHQPRQEQLSQTRQRQNSQLQTRTQFSSSHLHPQLVHPPLHPPDFPITTTRRPIGPWRLDMAQQHYALPDDEMAQLQKLSNNYEAEPTGPLVGPRMPSVAIATEYASADPVYQAKTANLPQKYSHYRAIRGDGRCGWRAIAFGYFEALIELGNVNKFAEEEARLMSLDNVMNAAGFKKMLYEDFADETYQLLRQLAGAIQSKSDADAILYETFNNESIQNYIITHMKILTAAWIKTHAEDFASWLVDIGDVHKYCDDKVMPIGSEIEDISLNALRTALLVRAGIALEIVYLDRSVANEANIHRFDEDGHAVGVIRLLYRPGHYDILYKVKEVKDTSVMAYFTFPSQNHHTPIYNLGFQNVLATIPGMSYIDPQPSWSSPQYTSMVPFAPVPSFDYPTQHNITPPMMMPNPSKGLQPLQPEVSLCNSQQPTNVNQAPIYSTAEPMAAMNTAGPAHVDVGPFRKSAWELEPELIAATSQMPLRTSIFKNSHFNTAHFMNPYFQPEEWRPDDDYIIPTSNGLETGDNPSGRSFRTGRLS